MHLKRGIHLKEVDESGACGAEQLPITDTDCLEVLGGSSCYGRNVGSLASGFVVSTLLQRRTVTEHLNLPVMNCQPMLINPYQAVTDDHQDGDPSSCCSLGRLKRNLEEIRKRFNAYRACPNGDFAIPSLQPASALIFEELSSNREIVTKTPSPFLFKVYPLPMKVEDLHLPSKSPKGVRRSVHPLLLLLSRLRCF
ncbi:hypothetical protein Nepgr_024032 [Nepenthes gracilis]|uniref:Uncharacterized protein n=1 Tax=Nepenthes gracilis TaxID=150966 RepID=A0AAD3T450_NEPGR|nr:hypothetical protein Nepgr_024032 [Nepenthes gracilis]